MYVNVTTSVCDIFLDMKLSEIIGNNLRQARKDKHLTQKEVAAKFGMTQQQYSRFENGIFELNYFQIVELCKLYDITPNDLFFIE